MGRVSWITQVGQCSHRGPKKRARARGDLTVEAEAVGMVQPQTKACEWPLEAGEGKERILPKTARRNAALLTP